MASEKTETPPQTIPADAEEVATPDEGILKDLYVLPPLQKDGTVDWNEMEDAILLPPIRANEPVASIRAALGEIPGYAHLSNFRFVLQDGKGTKSESKTTSSSLISRYTGRDAIVSVPVLVRSLDTEPMLLANGNLVPKDTDVVLDEYGDLTALLQQGLKDGSCFRLVLERYDVASIRDQVVRVRSLLDGNAPGVVSLVAEKPAAAEPKENGKQDSSEESSGDEKAENKEAKKDKEAKVEKLNIPKIPQDRSVALDGSNTKDFYYLASGEEESLYEEKTSGSKPSKKKRNKSKNKNGGRQSPPGGSKQSVDSRLNELDETCRVKCTIRYSGFHPPPQSRRLMGDLCYLEVIPPGFPDEPILNITAIPTGFYLNRSKVENGSYKFDPAPASNPCFSHELLDCILQASESMRNAWGQALAASKERAELNTQASRDNPLFALHRVAVRGQHSSVAAVSHEMDAVVFRPSWLVPMPRDVENESAWNHNSLHDYDSARAEDNLCSSFGLDLRAGPPRDWNEELQGARELPKSTQLERMERARLIHKVMTDFGEAALLGVKGICDGQIAPMNVNEPNRSHVYLHNNIFFSRAIDSGIETFKVTTGDKCARKSASRDAQCVGQLHSLDVVNLHTLATVLVDYLGTRYICQSIVPGILTGEKTHKLLYGAVEATSPLSWDEDMHELLEETIGKSFMVASRPIPTRPLTDKRLELVEKMKEAIPFLPEQEEKEDEDMDLPLTRNVCGPLEAKGIEGSDHRKYVLDFTRLTPRDANWVPVSEGGTGVWETVLEEEKGTANGDKITFVPETLDDEEWAVAVLRPELITAYTHKKMAEYMKAKEELEEVSAKNDSSKDQSTSEATLQKGDSDKKDEKASSTKELTDEDKEHLKSMRLNVNLFLPNVKPIAEIDESFRSQVEDDIKRVCEVSLFLWDTVLPKITEDIREGSSQKNQIDGASLTEMLHQRGVNCRYLGRLATLAAEKEKKDIEGDHALKHEQKGSVPRMRMPLYWLEMLECEMVARAAKHVLDSYLTEDGGVAAAQPAQTIASFLSALVSSSEETAGETELRLSKEQSKADEDDYNALTMFDVGGGGDAVPKPIRGRTEVWEDIEREVGRRFRYTLSLYNQGGLSFGDRAIYTPLLRRFCQRTGVRLAAETYDVGGKCLCNNGTTSGGKITPSYPISPLDIVEIVPLVKHAAAHGGEGFVPCSTNPGITLPSLHILLPDAKIAIEKAHIHFSARLLPQALELAQQATQLYQHVTDSPIHASVLLCLDLTSAILFEAGELQLAADNCARALALSVQLHGFDSPEALACHTKLSHFYFTSGNLAGGAKHLRAAMYLMELMAGPRYPELSNCYSRLGTLYYQVKQNETALRFIEEATRRYSPDRLSEGMLANSKSAILGSLGQYRAAVDSEKHAYKFYARMVGENNEMTQRSVVSLQALTKLAVAEGKSQVSEEKLRRETAAADAVANQIEAEEVQAEKKQRKSKKKNKKR